MSVYFIQAENGPIKIGKAKDVNRRFYQLQLKHSEPLKILGIVDGYTQEELSFHQQFASLRLHGEWFEPKSELIDYIAANAHPFELAPKPLTIIRKRKRGQRSSKVAIKLDFQQLLLEKQAREKRKINASDLSKETGMSRYTLYRFEKGISKGIEFDTLETLCDYFNCSISDLLTRTK